METKKVVYELHKLNFRITVARKEIIKIFSLSKKPLSAKDVYQNLTKKNIIVNLTTVYRELHFLQKHGYLKEIHLYANEKFFESSMLMHHHHLICDKCGSIEDLDGCLLKNLDSVEEKGFLIKRHVLEFYGLCAKCKRSYEGQ